jgi:hypothetical protein
MFQGLNVLEFTERFSTDDKCREYLSDQKWKKVTNAAIVVMRITMVGSPQVPGYALNASI